MDLSGKGLTTVDQVPRFAQAMDMSYNKLQSLKGGATHSHKTQLHIVEELLVQHNRLTSLAGVGAFVSLKVLDCSNNSLRRVDAATALELCELAVLSHLDLSNNNIGDVRLDEAFTKSSAGGAHHLPPSNAAPFSFLSRIDLSFNMLSQLPNLSSLKALKELHLDNNQLTNIENIPEMLPVQSLSILTLHDNQLDQWHQLAGLTTFADTLTALTIANNPFCETVRFSLKTFVAWLLPVVDSIDDEAITAVEQSVMHSLFRGPENQLSEELLSLMDEGRENELHQYLQQHCVLTPSMGTTNNYNGRHAGGGDDPSSMALVRASATSLVSSIGGGGAVGYDGEEAGSAGLAQVVNSLSVKLKNVTEVVRVLRRQDLKKRETAATTIQKYYKGYVLRRGLPRSAQYRLKSAHHATLVAKAKGSSSNQQEQKQQQEVHPQVEASLQTITAEVETLNGVMQTIWNDMGILKSFVHTQRVAAARKIQAFYKGHKARLRYHRVLLEYRRFAAKFAPAVIKIQSIVRMYIQRKKFLIEIRKEREISSLKSNVSKLQTQMEQMMNIVLTLQDQVAAQSQVAVTTAVASSSHQQHPPARSSSQTTHYQSPPTAQTPPPPSATASAAMMTRQHEHQPTTTTYDGSSPPGVPLSLASPTGGIPAPDMASQEKHSTLGTLPTAAAGRRSNSREPQTAPLAPPTRRVDEEQSAQEAHPTLGQQTAPVNATATTHEWEETGFHNESSGASPAPRISTWDPRREALHDDHREVIQHHHHAAGSSNNSGIDELMEKNEVEEGGRHHNHVPSSRMDALQYIHAAKASLGEGKSQSAEMNNTRSTSRRSNAADDYEHSRPSRKVDDEPSLRRESEPMSLPFSTHAHSEPSVQHHHTQQGAPRLLHDGQHAPSTTFVDTHDDDSEFLDHPEEELVGNRRPHHGTEEEDTAPIVDNTTQQTYSRFGTNQNMTESTTEATSTEYRTEYPPEEEESTYDDDDFVAETEQDAVSNEAERSTAPSASEPTATATTSAAAEAMGGDRFQQLLALRRQLERRTADRMSKIDAGPPVDGEEEEDEATRATAAQHLTPSTGALAGVGGPRGPSNRFTAPSYTTEDDGTEDDYLRTVSEDRTSEFSM